MVVVGAKLLAVLFLITTAASNPAWAQQGGGGAQGRAGATASIGASAGGAIAEVEQSILDITDDIVTRIRDDIIGAAQAELAAASAVAEAATALANTTATSTTVANLQEELLVLESEAGAAANAAEAARAWVKESVARIRRGLLTLGA